MPGKGYSPSVNEIDGFGGSSRPRLLTSHRGVAGGFVRDGTVHKGW